VPPHTNLLRFMWLEIVRELDAYNKVPQKLVLVSRGR
jgi:hypothetical protein